MSPFEVEASTRALRSRAERIKDGYNKMLMRWAADTIDALQQAQRDPHGWQEMDLYTPRPGYVLVQDGEEIYRARRIGGTWYCDDDTIVYPSRWMSFEALHK
jgi:hypothetical protein